MPLDPSTDAQSAPRPTWATGVQRHFVIVTTCSGCPQCGPPPSWHAATERQDQSLTTLSSQAGDTIRELRAAERARQAASDRMAQELDAGRVALTEEVAQRRHEVGTLGERCSDIDATLQSLRDHTE